MEQTNNLGFNLIRPFGGDDIAGGGDLSGYILLLESGDALLLEDGSYIVLE